MIVSGIGGVGKTQIAVEYAHRFANTYDLVWWIDADRPALIADQMAALALAALLPTTGHARDGFGCDPHAART